MSRRLALIQLMLLVPAAASAAVQLPDPGTMTWGAVPGAVGYHVYRGVLQGGLPADYGACFVGSVQGTSAPIPGDPPPGVVYTYLISSFDEYGDTDLGSDSSGTPRFPGTPCVPALRYFALMPNGDPGDGVVDGREPRRNLSAYAWAGGPGGAPSGHGERIMRPEYGSGVYLPTGEFFLKTLDHERPGRGLSFTMERSYRSQIRYRGPLGHNWDSNINARLVPQGSDVLFHDGSGRAELFVHTPPAGYLSPPGLYAVLHPSAGGEFRLRWPDGTIEAYHGFDGSNLQGALLSIEDRSGNRMTYQYDHQGLLIAIVDSMGRVVAFAYDAAGRIVDVTDWAGRSWHYAYDAAGDLAAARSPLVTGTPNGNDFPAGKTTTYTYSFGFVDQRLNHNLLTIVSPNESASGIPLLQNVYDTAVGFNFDRVVAQDVGGTNASGIPAGGIVSYSYVSMNPGGDPADPALPRRTTTVVDSNGNEKEYVHNFSGQCISETERTNRNVRPGEPDYTTTYLYNGDGEMLMKVRPLQDRVVFSYDSPGLDRYREGNVLEVRRIADPLSGGGRGDGHGGEINDVATTMAYEPVYNSIVSLTEPRGNDPSYVPQNGGPHSAARYTTAWTLDYMEGDPALNGIDALAAEFGIDLTGAASLLGDRNDDGRTDQAAGNVVRRDDPAVMLDPASNQALIAGGTTQEIVTLSRFNDLGQPIGVTDAEENVHQFTYHPETDPDGDGAPTPTPPDGRILDPSTGGYLATSLTDTTSGAGRNNGTDPPPAGIREDYVYDAVGNLTHHIDGRGVLTRRIVNQLDQLVELRRAAATATAGGPDGDAATGRGKSGLTPFSFKVRLAYDADDNVVERRIEDRDQDRGAGAEAEDCLVWDIKQGKIREETETATGAKLVTEYRYDPNDNLIQVIQPEGNVDEMLYDERELLFQETRGLTGPRGGAPATRVYSYDANGNLQVTNDARGNLIDVIRDGFDRIVRRTDQVGNTREAFYDPASNLVRSLLRGPVGGPSPTNRSGAANVDLAEEELDYDEMHRLIRGRKTMFVPAGALPVRTPELVEGMLAPGDGAVNDVIEYDRLSRTTFILSDTGTTQRLDHDGADRVIVRTLPDGSTIETFHDANSNTIEEVLTEVASSPGLPAETFITTSFHDALDRMTMTVDNLGQAWRLDYDSFDAVRTVSDPNGPPGGAINRRSPAHAATTVGINGHGNVTRYGRDGAGRLLLTERILTASGLGDGTLNPAPDTTNPHNPDGLIRSASVWDDNSLIASRFDDDGNRTDYDYDNLNRLVQTTSDDGTSTVFGYDAEDNLAVMTDPNGSAITHTYDPANRRVQTDVARAAGIIGTTQQIYEWDGLGRNTRSVDNNDPADPLDDAEIRTIYDSLDRVIEEQQALGTAGTKVVDHAWEGDTRLTAITYPAGRRIEYAHDSADRLSGVTDPARSESAALQYLGMNRVHTRSYGNGIRATVLNDAGTVDQGYDGVQRLVELRHLDSSNALLAGFRTTYDAAGNRRSTVRPHDFLVTGGERGELYELDGGYRLVDFQEAYVDPALTPVAPPVDSQSWILNGDADWETMTRDGTDFGFTPSNMHEYDENQSGNTRVDDGAPDDVFDDLGTPVADGLNHAHDRNGNRIDSGRHLYAFDYLDRLVTIREPANGALIGEYRYDAENRRVRRTISAGGAGGTDTRRYLYTAAPSAARKKPGRTTYQPITLERGYGVSAAPYVPGGAVVEERDELDAIQREVAFGGGRPLWQIQPDGSSQYYHADGRGSIAMLTAGAGSTTVPGQILERVTYDPFGKPTFEDAANQPIVDRSGNFAAESAYDNPYLFGALWYDPESSARGQTPKTDFGSMMKAGLGRYYDPNEGRSIIRRGAGCGVAAPGSFDAGWGPDSTGSGPYGDGTAPTNLGTWDASPMHVPPTAGSMQPGVFEASRRLSFGKKPREIVVVGSKVKDVVREAGHASDSSSSDKRKQSLYFPETMLNGKKPREIVVVGSKVKDVVRDAGLSDLLEASRRRSIGEKPREIVVVGSKVKDVVREAGHASDSSGSDKRKQSLYFPETMLKGIDVQSAVAAPRGPRRIPPHSPEWTNARNAIPGPPDAYGRVKIKLPASAEVMDLKRVYLPPPRFGGEDLNGSWWGERLCVPSPRAP